MDQLLDTLLTVAELHEFKANPNRAAAGVCLESEQDAARGVIAKVMVRAGTLRVGDIVVCGSSHGRIKALYDTLQPNRQLTHCGPSVPVNITGLDEAPAAGERFYVLDDIAKAREIARFTRDDFENKGLVRIDPEGFLRSLPRAFAKWKAGTEGRAGDLELDHPSRCSWFARSDRERIEQAGAPGSSDQCPSKVGWWNFRGRRHVGKCISGCHRRIQCDSR